MSNEKEQNKEQTESLSFADITAEIGDVRIPVRDEQSSDGPDENKPAEAPFGGTVIVDESKIGQSAEPDPNRPVLTGSSPTARPMWLEGLLSAGLAALIIAPILFGFAAFFQPGISYMVMFLALGAALWSLFGLQVEKEPAGKRMCLVSAAAGVIVAFIAFLVR